MSVAELQNRFWKLDVECWYRYKNIIEMTPSHISSSFVEYAKKRVIELSAKYPSLKLSEIKFN